MVADFSLFNQQWYLEQNPDVAQAVSLGRIDARQHFELYGKAEGRSPGPLFDTEQYLAANPDVAAAVDRNEMTAYDHFVNFGVQEDRSPLDLFDVDFYLEQNLDVAAAVERDEMSAVQHFLLYGQSEGRPVHPVFDLGAYMDANPDVAAAVESGVMSAMEHLMLFGFSEPRDLGNGVNLELFAQDPAFMAALASGDASGALLRVAEVAPFLPDFAPPVGWTPDADTPIPIDFVPPGGVKLVIPTGVDVPANTILPPSFEDQTPGSNPINLTVDSPDTITLTMAAAAEFNDWIDYEPSNTISGSGTVIVTGTATDILGTGEVNLLGISTPIQFENDELRLEQDGLIVVVNAASVSGAALSISGLGGLDATPETVELRGTQGEDFIDSASMETADGAILITIGGGGADTVNLGTAGQAIDRVVYFDLGDGGTTGDLIDGFSTEDQLVFSQEGFGPAGQGLTTTGAMSTMGTARATATFDPASSANFNGIIRVVDDATANGVATTANTALAGSQNGVQAILLMQVSGNTEIYHWNDGGATADARVQEDELTLLGTLVGVSAASVTGQTRTGMDLDLDFGAP